MADDKSIRDGRDRARVSGSEDYEVRHFASEAGISVEQAKRLIERHGNDRDLLMAEAKKLR